VGGGGRGRRPKKLLLAKPGTHFGRTRVDKKKEKKKKRLRKRGKANWGALSERLRSDGVGTGSPTLGNIILQVGNHVLKRKHRVGRRLFAASSTPRVSIEKKNCTGKESEGPKPSVGEEGLFQMGKSRRVAVESKNKQRGVETE